MRNKEHLRWAPDSTRLLFTIGSIYSSSIYVVQADGTGSVKVTDGWMPEWSPDGTQIAFIMSTGTGISLGVFTLGDTASILLTADNNDNSFAWAPDGKHLVFVRSLEIGMAAVGRIRPDGTDLTWLGDIRQGSVPITWSPDGAFILFSFGPSMDAGPNGPLMLGPAADPAGQLTMLTAGYQAVWAPR